MKTPYHTPRRYDQQTNPSLIIFTRINDYSNTESLFLAMEIPKILEDALPEDTPAIVSISEDGVYVRVLATEKDITQIFNHIVNRILEEKDNYETAYGIKITPDYIYRRITLE